MGKQRGECELQEREGKGTDGVLRDVVHWTGADGGRGELEGVEAGPFARVLGEGFRGLCAVPRLGVGRETLLYAQR